MVLGASRLLAVARCALPIELDRRCLIYSIKNNHCSSYLTQKILCAPRSLLYYLMKQYAYLFTKWWRMQGSNLRPLACKASALPAELILRKMVTRTGLEPVIPP